jgi:tripartite-type tricarboxylate transporter receptor subunit TctC
VIFFDVMGIPLGSDGGALARGRTGANEYSVGVYCAARKKDDSIKARSREEAMVFRALAASAALVLSMLTPAGNAAAEGYPAKPVRLIVPFAAGGPTDVIARIVAQKLSESFGQQVVTENIPGAGGNTGVTMVARAPADGYTILVVSTGFIVNPSMYAKISYDPVKDFAPITLVAASPNVVSVNPDFPAKSMKELVDLVKANPGKYSFAQPATGSTPHLAGELFKQKYALDLVTLPFNGAALAVNSTIGGHTPIAFTALPPAMSNIKEGKLRGLAVLASKRSPALPDVPTNGEAGVPDLESDTLTGIVAPAGTPKEVIERWRGDIVKMVATPEVRQRLEALGFAPVANTSDEFGARIKSEIAKWGKVVRDANIRAD